MMRDLAEAFLGDRPLTRLPKNGGWWRVGDEGGGVVVGKRKGGKKEVER